MGGPIDCRVYDYHVDYRLCEYLLSWVGGRPSRIPTSDSPIVVFVEKAGTINQSVQLPKYTFFVHLTNFYFRFQIKLNEKGFTDAKIGLYILSYLLTDLIKIHKNIGLMIHLILK